MSKKEKGIPNVLSPEVGQNVTVTYEVTQEKLLAFLAVAGNGNMAHTSPDHASLVGKRRPAVPSSFLSLVSSYVLGNYLPGAGCRVLMSTKEATGLVFPGDTLSVTATVRSVEESVAEMEVSMSNGTGEVVCTEHVEVLLPPRPMAAHPEKLPKVRVRAIGAKFESLLERAKDFSSVVAVVAYPKEVEPIRGALLAQEEGLATVIFVGVPSKIKAIAAEHNLSLEGAEIVATEDDSVAACKTAVNLVRELREQGTQVVLCKGSPKTDVILQAIINKEDRSKGLATKGKVVLTHGLVMDVPSYSELIALGDVAVVPHPSPDVKALITERCAALLRATGTPEVRAAFLAGSEGVTKAMPETEVARELETMTAHCCVGEGPLSLDLATSPERAQRKGHKSKIGNKANAFIFPTLASGNFVYKALELFADAVSAGIVFGADVPVVLISRGDDAESFLFSIALAQMLLGSGEYAKLS